MKPRELSREDCESLLSKERYGRLALSLDDVPYIVPMSYVYSGSKIYLHSRGNGRKVETVSKNPRVCFEVDHLERIRWLSVIVMGKAELFSDSNAKKKMFDAFVGKDLKGHGGKQFELEELERMEMTIWEIEIEEMTGREGMW
ncbi:MAG TPA: pyridoxamine 5'-phosphate oxidase family protein [Methanothrix sp.]|nr:pyridoxamine 5'-phosphate oxidase family protein [Methanothrix sp.]